MSDEEKKAVTLLKQMSTPKIIVISALVGGSLGVANNFLPGSITWNEQVVELPNLGWALKIIFVAIIAGVIFNRFKNGKFEWLRKSGDEST